jgi:hypothetical protein
MISKVRKTGQTESTSKRGGILSPLKSSLQLRQFSCRRSGEEWPHALINGPGNKGLSARWGGSLFNVMPLLAPAVELQRKSAGGESQRFDCGWRSVAGHRNGRARRRADHAAGRCRAEARQCGRLQGFRHDGFCEPLPELAHHSAPGAERAAPRRRCHRRTHYAARRFGGISWPQFHLGKARQPV